MYNKSNRTTTKHCSFERKHIIENKISQETKNIASDLAWNRNTREV